MTHHEEYLVVLYRCAKFDWNRCSSFDKIVLTVCTFGLKTPIHAPQNCGFWRISPPKWAELSTIAKNAYPSRKHVTQCLIFKIGPPVFAQITEESP